MDTHTLHPPPGDSRASAASRENGGRGAGARKGGVGVGGQRVSGLTEGGEGEPSLLFGILLSRVRQSAPANMGSQHGSEYLSSTVHTERRLRCLPYIAVLASPHLTPPHPTPPRPALAALLRSPEACPRRSHSRLTERGRRGGERHALDAFRQRSTVYRMICILRKYEQPGANMRSTLPLDARGMPCVLVAEEANYTTRTTSLNLRVHAPIA